MSRSTILVATMLAFLLTGGVCHAQHQDTSGVETSSEEREQWIGTRYPPLPEGVTDRGGATIGDARYARYSIDDKIVDEQHMLWFTRRVSERNEEMNRVILDVLVLPEIPEDYKLEYAICGTPSEREDVEIDPEIVAIARTDETTVRADVKQAWRADRDSEQFTSLSPGNLGCLNPTPSSSYH